jgi:hypothetical protein
MRRLLLIAALAGLPVATPAAAQSLFGTRGLGVPILPVDGAGRALGGVGVGMWDLAGSVVNPAAGATLGRRGAILALENTALRVEHAGSHDAVGATRFPLVRLFVPVGGAMLSASYGGFLDQTYAVESTSTLTLDGVEIGVADLVDSRGGIAQLRLGLAYPLLESLGVGVAVGYYAGEQDYRVTRRFTGEDVALAPYVARTVRTQSAPLLSAGVRWHGSPFLRAGAALTWAGTLRGSPEIGDPPARDVAMPLQLAAGVSAILGSSLMAAAGAEWAGWAAAANDLESGAVDAWRFGGGIELRGASLRDRPLPVRLGASLARLPFPLEGEAPSEWSLSAGLGAILAGEPDAPLARADAGVERGSRSAGSLAETFWRLTVSVAVFGR